MGAVELQCPRANAGMEREWFKFWPNTIYLGI